MGAAFLGGFGSNDIYGNLRDGVPSDFSWFHPADEGWPAWVGSPTISDVWWGTTDAEAIAATVWDGSDSEDHPAVIVADNRSGPIEGAETRVVLATRRQHYQDGGEEIPVFLTLYNPGPARSAKLAITLRGAPFDGVVDYPGATGSGGIWTLDMPEDSVWFATIDTTTYDGTSIDDVMWQATLSDEAGAPIGVTATARYITEPAE